MAVAHGRMAQNVNDRLSCKSDQARMMEIYLFKIK